MTWKTNSYIFSTTSMPACVVIWSFTCMCSASSGCSPIRPSVMMTRFPASLDVWEDREEDEWRIEPWRFRGLRDTDKWAVNSFFVEPSHLLYLYCTFQFTVALAKVFIKKNICFISLHTVFLFFLFALMNFHCDLCSSSPVLALTHCVLRNDMLS